MRRALLFFTCLLAGAVLRAQEIPENVAMAFSRISPDPQTAGRAYAGRASLSQTGWAAFRNPSAVALQEKALDVAASYQYWAPGGEQSGVSGFGAAFRHGRFGLTAGLLLNNSPHDADLGFAPTDRNIALGAGLAVTDRVAAGLSAHFLRNGLLPDYSLKASAVDLLLTARFADFRICGGLAGLGTLVQGNIRTPLPTSLALAGEWEKTWGGHSLTLDLDVDVFLRGGLTTAFGAEYNWKQTVFLRGGYHLATGTPGPVLPSFASLGAGVQFRGIRLDLAWLTAHPLLGNTLLVGCGFCW